MANLKQTVARWLLKSVDINDFLGAFPQFRAMSALKSLDTPAQAAVNSPYVWACLDRIATAAGVQLWLYDRKGDAVDDGPAAVLRAPNTTMDWVMFVEQTVMLMETHGVAYWFMPDVNGRPSREILYPLGGDVVQPDGNELPVRRYRYQGKLWPAENFIAILRPDPNNSLDGTSPVEAARLAWQADYSLRQFADATMRNGAALSGLLTTEHALSPEQQAHLESEFGARYVGARNAGKVAVLGGAGRADFKPLTMRPADASVLELLGDSRETICGIMGVPPALVGTLEYANYSNMDAQMVIFHELKIAPLWRRIEAIINTRYLPLWTEARWRGLTARFDEFKSLFLAQVLDNRLTAWTNALRAGVLTINEVRGELLGMDPLPWGDAFWGSYGTVDLSRPGAAPAGLLGYYPRAVNAGAEVGRQESARKLGVLMSAARQRKSLFTEEQIAAVWKSFDALEASWRKRYAKEMGKLLGSVRDELVQSARDNWDTLKTFTYDRDKARAAFVKARLWLLAAIWTAGGKEGEGEATGKSFDQRAFTLTEAAKEEILRRANHFSLLTEDATWAAIEGALATAVDESYSLQQVIDALMESGAMSPGRAENIARTEVGGSLNAGKLDGYQQAGFNAREWVSAQDYRVRGNEADDEFDHRIMNGVVVKIGVPFNVGGEMLQHPGDPAGSPGNICNCRCTIVPARLEE